MASPIDVKIKRMGTGGTDVPLPRRMTEHAAGFDLCAALTEPTSIMPGEILVVPCGFAMALPEGYEAQVRPRSGLASKSGITLINTPGTIDSDYRGEVKVPLVNLGKEPFVIERGMRIAQMVVMPVPKVNLIEVTELDDTARGKGGFGHTGH
ncbi:MAG TPA: dUTP diphosphatase [Tepidisphaeraceae bacterium]|nr:dUTP diphosphatase [Tepidisphaeraceae bacterium]